MKMYSRKLRYVIYVFSILFESETDVAIFPETYQDCVTYSQFPGHHQVPNTHSRGSHLGQAATKRHRDGCDWHGGAARGARWS